jgi:hypothetical protein
MRMGASSRENRADGRRHAEWLLRREVAAAPPADSSRHLTAELEQHFDRGSERSAPRHAERLLAERMVESTDRLLNQEGA